MYPTAALTREPGSNADMESDLRFVLKAAPGLGAVDFLCATEARPRTAIARRVIDAHSTVTPDS